eukprot:TRINITY_DN11633_c0_g1_i6.p1 TRINITY_DN11633_c0_g1~~TRINITY_DN11633_c0_g1_i6.p1  ORF type:complete len:1371 (+),score=308.75 TRINITY_DN11633_c0_g1_i6:33-4115(+)
MSLDVTLKGQSALVASLQATRDHLETIRAPRPPKAIAKTATSTAYLRRARLQAKQKEQTLRIEQEDVAFLATDNIPTEDPDDLEAAVRSLPDSVVSAQSASTKPPLGLSERLRRNREERHRSALQRYNADLADLREDIEQQMQSCSSQLEATLKSTRAGIQARFDELGDHPLNTTVEDLRLLETNYIQVCRKCDYNIKEYCGLLENIESSRLERLTNVLKQNRRLLTDVAYLLPNQVDRWCLNETVRLNSQLATNRAAIAEIRARLITQNVRLEERWGIRYRHVFKSWQEAQQNAAVDKLVATMNDESELQSEVDRRLDLLSSRQTHAYNNLLDCLRNLGQLSSKQGLLKLEQLQHDLEQHHEAFADQMERLLEDLEDKWQDDLQTSTRRLATINAADSLHDAKELIDTRCRTLASSRLAQRREDYANVQASLRTARADLMAKTKSLLAIMQQLEQSVLDVDNSFQSAQIDIERQLSTISQHLSSERTVIEESINENIDNLRQAGGTDQLASVQSILNKQLSDVRAMVVKAAQEAQQAPLALEVQTGHMANTHRKEVLDALGLIRLNPSIADADGSFVPEHNLATEDHLYRIKKQRWAPTGLGDRPGPPKAPPPADGDAPEDSQLLSKIKTQLVLDQPTAFEIWRSLCQAWVERVEKKTDQLVSSAKEKLKTMQAEAEMEYQMKLAVHDSRIERVNQDVHNVRSAELMLHQQHVVAHCEKLEKDLHAEQSRFLDKQSTLHEEVEQFAELITTYRFRLPEEASSSRIKVLHDEVRSAHTEFQVKLRTQLVDYRKSIDANIRLFREKNAKFRASFRTFTEKGNFSTEEIVKYQQVIDQIFVQIDTLEGVVLEDLDALEAQYLQQAREAIELFDSAHTVHCRDVALLDETVRIMNSYKVRMQSEVNHSHSRHQELIKGMTQLEELSKEHPPRAQELFETTRAVSGMILERSLYLDCIRPGAPHSSGTGEVRRASRHALVGKARSASKSAARARRGQKGSPSKLNNTLPVALRGMRLTVEDWPQYREGSFLGNMTAMRIGCREDVLQAAVPYYEKGYAKHTARPNKIKETIQAFMDMIQVSIWLHLIGDKCPHLLRILQLELNEMGQRAAEFRTDSARELVTAVEQATAIMAKGSSAIFQGITHEHLEKSKEMVTQLRVQLDDSKTGHLNSFDSHIAQLKPALAHPARAAELQAVEAQEASRVNALDAVIRDFEKGVQDSIDEMVGEYVAAMNSMVSGMVEVLELALIEPELYVPDLPDSSTSSQDLELVPKAEQRAKGRFPLLVAGMVVPKPGMRATSGHGVGMLITWLHKTAMDARNTNLEEAKDYCRQVQKQSALLASQVRDQGKSQKATWTATLDQLKQL